MQIYIVRYSGEDEVVQAMSVCSVHDEHKGVISLLSSPGVDCVVVARRTRRFRSFVSI